MKEPLRMGESDELPAALRDAFQTLGRDAPSAETVLRVQRTLHALPAAAPGAVAVGSVGLSKLLVVATLIAGGIASLAVLNQRAATPPSQSGSPVLLAHEHAVVSAAAQAASSAAAGAEASGAQPALAAAGRGAPLDRAAQARREERPLPSQAAAPSRVVIRAQPVLRSDARAARGSNGARALPAAQTRASRANAAPPAEPATEHAQALPKAPEAPAASTSQIDEAQLLAECRRLAQRDPAQALQKLELLA
jgi:hypothetical protein